MTSLPKQKSRTQDGKWFEAKYVDAVAVIGKKVPVSNIRLYDTTSAGGGAFIPEVDGDFITAFPGGALLVECKSSEKHESLRSCLSANVSTGQAASHRLWHRTGNPCIFLFYTEIGDMVECWHGFTVGTHRAEGKPLPKEGWLFRCKLSEMTELLKNTVFSLSICR